MIPQWPSCGKKGCPWPALFKVQMENAAGPLTAFLCLFCVIEIKQCLAELSEAGNQDLRLLEQEQIRVEDVPVRVLEETKELP
jgi:hypothetical protein